MNANGTLTWQFLEVDISPCVRADYGGDKSCPKLALLSKHGNLHPPTLLRDEVLFQ